MEKRHVYLSLITIVSFSIIYFSGSSGIRTGNALAQGMMMGNGTAWGSGSFSSNGERIYFTSTSKRGTRITYSSGPSSNNWMMMGGRLACVSCHGVNGRGGKHHMGMMQVSYNFV